MSRRPSAAPLGGPGAPWARAEREARRVALYPAGGAGPAGVYLIHVLQLRVGGAGFSEAWVRDKVAGGHGGAWPQDPRTATGAPEGPSPAAGRPRSRPEPFPRARPRRSGRGGGWTRAARQARAHRKRGAAEPPVRPARAGASAARSASPGPRVRAQPGDRRKVVSGRVTGSGPGKACRREWVAARCPLRMPSPCGAAAFLEECISSLKAKSLQISYVHINF